MGDGVHPGEGHGTSSHLGSRRLNGVRRVTSKMVTGQTRGGSLDPKWNGDISTKDIFIILVS